MKAKLIKQKGMGIQTINGFDYYLILDGKIYHTNPLTSGLTNGGRLSYDNCQAIERGYDLDELAKDRFGNSSHHTNNRCSFKEGFQKALELMGDKKFSEEDVATAYDKGQILNIKGGQMRGKKYVKLLQQTEWDVEIEMEKVIDETKIVGAVKGVKGSGNKITTYKSVPKLDADGCLILKGISK